MEYDDGFEILIPDVAPRNHLPSGDFAPGNKCNKSKPKQAGEIVAAHSTDLYRDSKGRILPGNNKHTIARGTRILDLKNAMLDAVSVQDMIDIMKEAKAMALNRELGPKLQLEAMTFYRDTVIGKPQNEFYLEKHSTSQKVTIDYSKLSTDDLRQLETTLQKTQVIEAVEYKGDSAVS